MNGKTIVFLNFFAAGCFVLSALMILLAGGSRPLGVMNLCLGTAWFCIAVMNRKKFAEKTRTTGTKNKSRNERRFSAGEERK